MKNLGETKRDKHSRKRLKALLLVSFLLFGISACGEAEEGSPEASVSPELVYVPEYIEIGTGEEEFIYDMLLMGDEIFYRTIVDYAIVLRRSSLVSDTVEDLAIESGANSWTIGTDGSTYMVVDEYDLESYFDSTKPAEPGPAGRFLVRYDESGEQVFRQDITELFSGDDTTPRIAVDGKGRTYLLTQGGILLFDENGKPGGTIYMSSDTRIYFSCFGRGSDGKVYVSDQDMGGSGAATLYQIDYEAGKLGNSYENFPSSGMYLSQDAAGNFLAYDSNAVYRYDPKTQENEKLFDWLDSGIVGSDVTAVGTLSDGRIAVVCYDRDSSENSVALLSGISAAEIPQKQEIVIGIMYSDPNLQTVVVDFNKNSEQYHVTVNNYLGNGADREDATARLNADIASGNGPDIILLNMLTGWADLAQKGAFEDLEPYLNQSAVLNREDRIDSVLDEYFCDSGLVAVPHRFFMATFVGRAADVGEEPGWTIDDVIALSEAHPGAELIEGYSRMDILTYCLMYSMDAFVDWDQGTCNFESDTFKRLLEFAAGLPETADDAGAAVSGSRRERIQNGQLLLAWRNFFDVDEFQYLSELFQGDVTAIGYPTVDGRPICWLVADGCYAISAESNVKDGAWAFIESYLTQEETSYTFAYTYPATWSGLDRMIEEAMEYRTDSDGNPLLDEYGNLVPIHEKTVATGDGLRYTYRVPTQEEIDKIMELIRIGSPTESNNQQILGIIGEEAEAFFRGQKSVDQVTEAIQSRVGIYVSENS